MAPWLPLLSPSISLTYGHLSSVSIISSLHIEDCQEVSCIFLVTLNRKSFRPRYLILDGPSSPWLPPGAQTGADLLWTLPSLAEREWGVQIMHIQFYQVFLSWDVQWRGCSGAIISNISEFKILPLISCVDFSSLDSGHLTVLINKMATMPALWG